MSMLNVLRSLDSKFAEFTGSSPHHRTSKPSGELVAKTIAYLYEADCAIYPEDLLEHLSYDGSDSWNSIERTWSGVIGSIQLLEKLAGNYTLEELQTVNSLYKKLTKSKTNRPCKSAKLLEEMMHKFEPVLLEKG